MQESIMEWAWQISTRLQESDTALFPFTPVLQAWADSSEAIYPCNHCEEAQKSEEERECGWCEAIAFKLDDDDGYVAEQSGDDTDIFIVKSPYFTYAKFCSPCAPGAGDLRSKATEKDGVKIYCFGHDFFEEGKAPYPVYSVETGKLVEP